MRVCVCLQLVFFLFYCFCCRERVGERESSKHTLMKHSHDNNDDDDDDDGDDSAVYSIISMFRISCRYKFGLVLSEKQQHATFPENAHGCFTQVFP